MTFNKITAEYLEQIIRITGKDRTIFEGEDLDRFSHDETEDLVSIRKW